MRKFRLPRKIKKKLRGNIWLYPADEKGSSLMAFPYKYQKDYLAYKRGALRNILCSESKNERKKYWSNLNKENYVSDEKLRSLVDDVFREDLRDKSYRILLEAKNSKTALQYYFHFINAYEQSEENMCCLAVDEAEQKLKKKYKKRFRSKKRW